jgi:hypothetical protein
MPCRARLLCYSVRALGSPAAKQCLAGPRPNGRSSPTIGGALREAEISRSRLTLSTHCCNYSSTIYPTRAPSNVSVNYYYYYYYSSLVDWTGLLCVWGASRTASCLPKRAAVLSHRGVHFSVTALCDDSNRQGAIRWHDIRRSARESAAGLKIDLLVFFFARSHSTQ